MITGFDTARDSCPTCRSRRLAALDYTNKNAGVCKAAVISGCKNCGLVFVNPPPSAAELDAYYRPGGAWDAKLRKREIGLPKKMEKLSKTPRSAPDGVAQLVALSDRLREQYGAHRVLDFGCGNGRMLDVFQEQGWETTGIDPISKHSVTRHRMLDAIPRRPSHDLVVFYHVLEHLENPLAVLREARACLFDDGHLFIGSPTLDQLTQHGKKDYCINRTQHITAYTRRSMTNLLALAGFVVEEWIEANRQYRMRLVARMAATPQTVRYPLRDAKREFHQLALAREGWWRVTMLPAHARLRAALVRDRIGDSSRT